MLSIETILSIEKQTLQSERDSIFTGNIVTFGFGSAERSP